MVLALGAGGCSSSDPGTSDAGAPADAAIDSAVNNIVDFLVPSARLVVEVDGGVHLSRRDADRRRNEALGALGFRVVRVAAEDVFADVGAVVAVLREYLG